MIKIISLPGLICPKSVPGAKEEKSHIYSIRIEKKISPVKGGVLNWPGGQDCIPFTVTNCAFIPM
jgi:hypothetical protein